MLFGGGLLKLFFIPNASSVNCRGVVQRRRLFHLGNVTANESTTAKIAVFIRRRGHESGQLLYSEW